MSTLTFTWALNRNGEIPIIFKATARINSFFFFISFFKKKKKKSLQSSIALTFCLLNW